MPRKIYVNLPVKDLEKSKAFFSALGFDFFAPFTNESAACLVLGENIYVMLLLETFFASFTNKIITDAKISTEVLVCISCASRDEVDNLVRLALLAGGRAPRQAVEHDFMYGHGFEDLDGHLWELIYQP